MCQHLCDNFFSGVEILVTVSWFIERTGWVSGGVSNEPVPQEAQRGALSPPERPNLAFSFPWDCLLGVWSPWALRYPEPWAC